MLLQDIVTPIFSSLEGFSWCDFKVISAKKVPPFYLFSFSYTVFYTSLYRENILLVITSENTGVIYNLYTSGTPLSRRPALLYFALWSQKLVSSVENNTHDSACPFNFHPGFLCVSERKILSEVGAKPAGWGKQGKGGTIASSHSIQAIQQDQLTLHC